MWKNFSQFKKTFLKEHLFIRYCTRIKFYVDSKEIEEFHIPLQNYLR